jgi:hypothetical protein
MLWRFVATFKWYVFAQPKEYEYACLTVKDGAQKSQAIDFSK